MKQKGFTLIELILVLSIMGIVLAMATPAIVSTLDSWTQTRESMHFEDEGVHLPVRLFEDIKEELENNEGSVNNDSLEVGDITYENDNVIVKQYNGGDPYPFTNNPEWEVEFNKNDDIIQITLILEGDEVYQTSIQEEWGD
ncbi:type II secretion system protein [Candidatus Absconditicoccus praedator]|uniref:type II secretion system protein n=1 Tax=Candidatus Absconditicoccus praedator TaxID=2735562 RepID=UPI001E4556B3|nr:type II secretion system protein [Candidatus Absconditicoccus praedator]UFX82793.1 type II secretion system protein [Candidatus Absconditicoccus praedator]